MRLTKFQIGVLLTWLTLSVLILLYGISRYECYVGGGGGMALSLTKGSCNNIDSLPLFLIELVLLINFIPIFFIHKLAKHNRTLTVVMFLLSLLVLLWFTSQALIGSITYTADESSGEFKSNPIDFRSAINYDLNTSLIIALDLLIYSLGTSLIILFGKRNSAQPI